MLWRQVKRALSSSVRSGVEKSLTPRRSRRGRALSVIEFLECRRLLTGTPYYFAAVSDYGTNGTNEANVATMINSWDGTGDALAALITAGDNRQQTGTGYATLVGNYYGEFVTEHRIFPVPGNHDWGDGSGYAYPTTLSDYRAYFNWLFPNSSTPDYYDFTSGPAHFFMLSGNINEPGSNGPQSAQANCLRQQLAASTSPWNIVVMHEPTVASVNAGTDWKNRHWSNPELQWPWKDWGVDAVITGHVHNYERFSIDGLPYFVNGVGGHENNVAFEYPPGAASLVRDNGHFGGILITADESTISFNYITTDGTTDTPRDTVTLTEPTPTSMTLSAKGEAWKYFHPYDNTDSTHANPGNVNGHYYDQDFYTTWFTSNDYSADARDDRVA